MRYIYIDEHKMWPQHSVRKWEVRKANMTGNNLLQKNQTKPDDLSNRFIIFCMPKRLQSSSRLEIHRKNNEAKLVLHVLNRNTGETAFYMQLHAIHFYLYNANFQHWWSQCTA